ncbi:MAG TPA: AraC family transcriptional regulator [Chitinophagaceae bacterium]|jgi:AraC-like DNA-binding protein|nr:AraC family transcriptional regulator [Chitinophagaceae bacterium]
MRRYVQYDPFNIYCFEAEAWPHPVHKHTYFEIIFIRDGAGRHVINGNSFPYQSGDVFLLGPEDYHFFEIGQLTRFCYIRFSETFLRDDSSRHRKGQETIASLLTSAYYSNGCIVQEEADKGTLGHLLSALIREYENRSGPSYELIMDSLLKAILSILARNLIRETGKGSDAPVAHPLMQQILLYIRQHIHEPARLRMENLAATFHYAPRYLAALFKKEAGESLQQYILRYKLKLIEERLHSGTASLSEISAEFGFTDESHLNKLFRKYYGVSPGRFRRDRRSSSPA